MKQAENMEVLARGGYRTWSLSTQLACQIIQGCHDLVTTCVQGCNKVSTAWMTESTTYVHVSIETSLMCTTIFNCLEHMQNWIYKWKNQLAKETARQKTPPISSHKTTPGLVDGVYI